MYLDLSYIMSCYFETISGFFPDNIVILILRFWVNMFDIYSNQALVKWEPGTLKYISTHSIILDSFLVQKNSKEA